MASNVARKRDGKEEREEDGSTSAWIHFVLRSAWLLPNSSKEKMNLSFLLLRKDFSDSPAVAAEILEKRIK